MNTEIVLQFNKKQLEMFDSENLIKTGLKYEKDCKVLQPFAAYQTVNYNVM